VTYAFSASATTQLRERRSTAARRSAASYATSAVPVHAYRSGNGMRTKSRPEPWQPVHTPSPTPA
jgi:hypothetical protein